MPKILAVDDSPTTVAILADFLETIGGHKVAVAKSGREAKEWMAWHHFEVLVFDYLIRDCNGLDLLRWAREQQVWTPCIITSAMDEYELEEIGAKAQEEGLGPAMVLPKTREPATVMLDEINKIMGRKNGQA